MENKDGVTPKSGNRIWSMFFTFICLALFVYYGFNNKESFQLLSGISIMSLILIAIGKISIYIGNGLFIKWSTEVFTRQLTIGEGIYVGILSAIGNFFGPLLGGASIRAVYLKKIHNLTFSKFTSTLMGYYLILFIINSLFAILALVLLDNSKQRNILLLFFSAWLVFLIILAFAQLPRKVINSKNKQSLFSRVAKTLLEIELGWKLISSKTELLRKLFFLASFSFTLNLLVSSIEFAAIGASISLSALMLYTVVMSVSLLVSFTPGAIGIRETMLLIISDTLGVSNNQILQVAIIDRGVTFFILTLFFLLTRSSKVKHILTSGRASI